MTDITTPDTAQDTQSVEGIANLLRARFAAGEKFAQTGDDFPWHALLEAMNIVTDEMLDPDMLAIHVTTLRGVLAGVLSAPGLGSIPKNYLDAAYRVINKEQRIADETGVPAPTFSIR